MGNLNCVLFGFQTLKHVFIRFARNDKDLKITSGGKKAKQRTSAQRPWAKHMVATQRGIFKEIKQTISIFMLHLQQMLLEADYLLSFNLG